MTIAELIAELQTYPPDWPVYVQDDDMPRAVAPADDVPHASHVYIDKWDCENEKPVDAEHPANAVVL